MQTYNKNQVLERIPEGKEDYSAKCVNGTFVGVENEGVVSFKGIPFAKAPIGNLRWKEPCCTSPDDGIYEAYYNAKSPIQTLADSERASFYEQGEDCLYLNIWTSSGYQGQKRPVMVFIHGGNYGWGGTADPLYDGHNFVKAHPEVVLVVITYRIGILGFMDFSAVPGGESYSKSGNLGLLDQVCALKYLQDNIESFGGDKSNVTIWGESAGAGSVSLLPLIPEAKGLFHRIIAESGSIALTSGKEQCLILTDKLLKESGAKTMDDLLALSENQIKQINEKLNDDNNFPERDGIVIPEDIYGAYKDGIDPNIDILIGTNADELRYWISELGGVGLFKYQCRVIPKSHMNFMTPIEKDNLTAVLKEEAEAIGDKSWAVSEVYNDIYFRLPAIKMAEAHSANGGNAYMYFWEKPSDIPNMGACHAVELAYVLNNLEDTIYTGKPADPLIASKVQEMWVNFAKTGNPSAGDIEWKGYDASSRNTMVIGDEIYQRQEELTKREEALFPLLKYYLTSNTYFIFYKVPIIRKIGIMTGFVAVELESSVRKLFGGKE